MGAPMVVADAERLLEHFSEGSFDLVHSRNALDHTWNPAQALEAMLQLLQPEGVLYLLHYRNEGQHYNYTPPHVWDFDVHGPITNRDALLRGKTGAVVSSFREYLEGRAT